MDLNFGVPKWGPESLHKVIRGLYPDEEVKKVYNTTGAIEPTANRID